MNAVNQDGYYDDLQLYKKMTRIIMKRREQEKDSCWMNKKWTDEKAFVTSSREGMQGVVSHSLVFIASLQVTTFALDNDKPFKSERIQ